MRFVAEAAKCDYCTYIQAKFLFIQRSTGLKVTKANARIFLLIFFFIFA